MLSPAKVAGQAALPAAAAAPAAPGHPRARRGLHLLRAEPQPPHDHDGRPPACVEQDCAPAAQQQRLAAAKHPPAHGAACDVAAAAQPDQAAPAGPCPGVYAGPPRVPEAEDQPLPASWVEESAPPALARPRGGSACGDVHVIMGPMFAGKSTALLDQVDALRREGRSVVLVKSALDTRYARSWVVTHDGRRARCHTASSLREFAAQLGGSLDRFDAVAVDEAQFFPDLVEFALEQAEGAGRHVVVAGLSTDYRRRSFGDIVHLVPHATRIQRLTANCFYCSGPAAYTVRIAGAGDGGGAQTLVGGADRYRPACGRCYRECTAAQPA
ncbi:hypothetical protein Rsub_09861 [Raphidocelis subcapitata]|uniref:thymidine kinase n=1 Tax=Raphidocelis subcapitata TaxID=307507 RepID=A0A2V0PAH2_9CHLO|nr:hypothetical protein Rsub_09861 [Raphidocelis subcapitata]|eukprot:GBF96519.1 hypothetical protein Rsub_09861 [Raphidocelis subcapitata]